MNDQTAVADWASPALTADSKLLREILSQDTYQQALGFSGFEWFSLRVLEWFNQIVGLIMRSGHLQAFGLINHLFLWLTLVGILVGFFLLYRKLNKRSTLRPVTGLQLTKIQDTPDPQQLQHRLDEAVKARQFRDALRLGWMWLAAQLDQQEKLTWRADRTCGELETALRDLLIREEERKRLYRLRTLYERGVFSASVPTKEEFNHWWAELQHLATALSQASPSGGYHS